MKFKKLYALMLTFVIVFMCTMPAFATGDSYEPNNDMYSSKTIPAYYSTISATLDNSADLDWYDFTVYGTGNLTLKLVPPAGKNYDFLVYWQGNIIAQGNTAGSGQTERVTIPVTNGRSYVVMVASPNGDYSDTSYVFGKDTFTSTLDAAYEPNNDSASAALVNIASNVNASISSSSDVDYYYFTASQTGSMQLGLIPPSGKTYDMYVLDKPTGQQLGFASATNSQPGYITFNTTQGRDYLVIVFGATSTDFYANIPYTLYKSN